jgi:predicted DNA-binding protein (UPF0251 family)
MSSTLIAQDMALAEAAEYLNVSRPYLLKLLTEGKTTLAASDLANYKNEQAKISQDALQQLVDQAQELNMGY